MSLVAETPSYAVRPVPPCEVLIQEYMEPLLLTQRTLARDLKVSRHRIATLISGKGKITAELALRLATYFKTTPELWLNLQQNYDLHNARVEWSAAIQRAIKPHPAIN